MIEKIIQEIEAAENYNYRDVPIHIREQDLRTILEKHLGAVEELLKMNCSNCTGSISYESMCDICEIKKALTILNGEGE